MGKLGDYRRRYLDREPRHSYDLPWTPTIGELKGDNMATEMHAANVGILARMLVERRTIARRDADRLRDIQKVQERARDESAAYLEGSAAAYGIACSIVAALMGEPDIETIARVGDSTEPAPGDVIRGAVDLDANSGRGALVDLSAGDHFAGMPHDREGMPS